MRTRGVNDCDVVITDCDIGVAPGRGWLVVTPGPGGFVV